MRDFLTRLSRARFPYEPLITVELDRARLIHNLTQFRKLAPDGQVAPVLKSNAYGHGLIEIATILEQETTLPFFIVDSYFEAISLRRSGIRTPLLVIGYTAPTTIDQASLSETSFTVTSLSTLRALNAERWPTWHGGTGGGIRFGRAILGHRHSIHLKIDTGMHRQGILPEEVPAAIDIIRNNPLISLEGICSHLAEADTKDSPVTERQIALWNQVVTTWKTAFPKLRYIHLSATDGHRYTQNTSATVSRLGLGLYGLLEGASFAPGIDLKPVLEMKTVISDVKKLKQGESLGYSSSFTATKDMSVATIPAGYYESIDRRLSNTGVILVGRDRVPCRILGRVSMNITSIDVSRLVGGEYGRHEHTRALIGQTAVIVSNNPADRNSFMSMAELCGTIPYELAVHIPAHLRRVVK